MDGRVTTATPVVLDLEDAMPNMVMQVDVELHISRMYGLRLRLAMALIRLAALVLGCGVEIGEVEGGDAGDR
jgi:hypothetical protein